MGCGASFVYSGLKNTHHRNPDIRINIIEATSILDYEDTDPGSSCRQTPVITRQTPVNVPPRSASASLHKRPSDHNATVVETQQEFHISSVTSFERPSSPIPTAVKTLCRIHTDNMDKDEVTLVL